MPLFGKKNTPNYGKAPDVSSIRRQELLLFQAGAGIKFKNLSLLNLAFTHSSYANETHGSHMDCNERLEFLGDSVLSVSVSSWLFRHLPDRNEGDFSRIRSYVVSEESLASIAEALEIDRYLIIGKGEELSGGRHKKAILADCMEAVFGAYYLDQGFDKATAFVERLLVPAIEDVLENKQTNKDYKTLLQEYVQKRYKRYPVYTLVKKTGPEHANVFYMEVTIQKKTYGPASGNNKKEAEQRVAEMAYKALCPQQA